MIGSNVRRALLACLVVGGLIALVYRWGATATNNQHAAEQLQLERAANAKYIREVDRGNTAQAELDNALQAQAASFDTLERAFNDLRTRHVPLTVRPRLVAARVPGAAAAAPGAPPAAGPDQATEAAPGCVIALLAPGDLGEPELSTGFVWMWNSALTGTDQPAGACSLADTSEGACAAGAGLTVADAAANHAENAHLCAEDRTRHNQLIDFILKGNAP